MKCEVCDSEMNLLFTSWYCPACEQKKAEKKTKTDVGGSTYRITKLDCEDGIIYFQADDDDGLIDEDPADDCLEPDFYSMRLERFLYIIDTCYTAMDSKSRRAFRQQRLMAITADNTWVFCDEVNPADLVSETAVYPEWFGERKAELGDK